MIYDMLPDVKRLLTKSEVTEYLHENGASNQELNDIREFYQKHFGNELIWHYPISDGLHSGTFLVPVQEGILSMPYDEIIEGDSLPAEECIVLKHCRLMDRETLSILIEEWISYSDALVDAMQKMIFLLT